MKPENVPEYVPDTERKAMVSRTPDYCADCEEAEIIFYGGREAVSKGLYDHIDPEAICESCGRKYRFTMGMSEPDGSHGREMRHLAGDWSDTFDDFAGYCDFHNREMKATKDLKMAADGQRVKARQFKCPECDLETVIMAKPD